MCIIYYKLPPSCWKQNICKINISITHLVLKNHCLSDRTSKKPLIFTQPSLLRKCHACFIYKYMYWMYSIYKSVDVRWGWHLVVINKWKALPCVSGRESQNHRVPAVCCKSTLQKTYVRYIQHIYLHVHIKRRFLPDPVCSDSVWCCSSLIPDLRPLLHCAIRHPRCCAGSQPWNNNIEEYKIYQTTSPHMEGPYSVKLNNQFFWDETLHLTIRQIWQKNVATECVWSLGLLWNVLHTWNLHRYLTVCL